MARDLRVFALEKAELLSSRLKELLSSGQGYVRDQFGLDLGLKPDVYPTWVILSTAAVGLLLLLRLSWAVVCGGSSVGKKRGSPGSQGDGEPGKAASVPIAKPEEQKKKIKKKTVEKNNQSNGKPVAAAQDAVKGAEVVSKPAPQIKTEKVHEVQALVQLKKNKKKTKTNVKPVQHVSTNDGKEPDNGAWVTKVSNREKRQQRRKDRGPEDSGSPGGVEAPKSNVEAPVATAPANTKKNRGNHVSSSWREEPSVNGGGWTDMSLKTPCQMGAMEGTKWSAIPTATHYRAPPKPQSWGQETQAWSGIDGHIKIDLNPGAFSMLGVNTTDPISNSMELQWARCPDVDDEWSGFRMAAVDPSSDWNAPDEHWGHYEEPPLLVTPAPPLKEQPVPNKVLEDEKDTDEPSGGADKSKKKRKKKKKTEEETASEAQTVSTVTLVNARPKPQELPVLATKKQNPSASSSQKKSEQTVEPPKPSQKKKVRRET
ncbi:metadherin a isoform X2 [Cyclopterus lumpus]|uniref:Metadherin a n=1 Tax=Cyclopterus lumpus TaxID=8103 RepID=A0A8C2YXC8_CYCLU|nr:metadherin a isoform X2 [Cyclopterus lumpus]